MRAPIRALAAALLFLLPAFAFADTVSLDGIVPHDGTDDAPALLNALEQHGQNNTFTVPDGWTVNIGSHIVWDVPGQVIACGIGAGFRLMDDVDIAYMFNAVAAGTVEFRDCAFDGNVAHNTAVINLIRTAGDATTLKLTGIETFGSTGKCLYIADGVKLVIRGWHFHDCSVNATASAMLMTNVLDTHSATIDSRDLDGDRRDADPAVAAAAAVNVVGTLLHPTFGRMVANTFYEPIAPVNAFGAIGTRYAPILIDDTEIHDGSLGVTSGCPSRGYGQIVSHLRGFGQAFWTYEFPGTNADGCVAGDGTSYRLLTDFYSDGMGSDGVIRTAHPLSGGTDGGKIVIANGIIRRFTDTGIFIYGQTGGTKADVTVSAVDIDASSVTGALHAGDKACVILRGASAGIQGPYRIHLSFACHGGGAATRALLAQNADGGDGTISADGIAGPMVELIANGHVSNDFDFQLNSAPSNQASNQLVLTKLAGGGFSRVKACGTRFAPFAAGLFGCFLNAATGAIEVRGGAIAPNGIEDGALGSRATLDDGTRYRKTTRLGTNLGWVLTSQ